MSWKRRLMMMCAAAALMVPSTSAFASETEEGCETDTDCTNGWSCEIVGESACASPPPRVPGEGPPSVTPCEPEEFKACVPPPPPSCDPSDAMSCGGDDVCVTYTFEACPGPAPDTPSTCKTDPNGNMVCDEDDRGGAAPPACTSSEESYCVPKFFAPCQADADCGTGFKCVDEQACSCTGSGFVPPGEPCMPGEDCTDPEPVPPPDCGCSSTGTKY